jgi:hypothetical protein
VQCEYVLANGLPYDVEVIGIVKACGCTSATIAKQRVGRGERTILKSQFDLRGRAGEFATHLTVVYRPAGKPEAKAESVICAAYANVDPIVRISPSELTFAAGQRATQDVSIEITDGRSGITGIAAGHKAFASSLDPDGRRVRVTFEPELWAEGNGTPSLVINTNCPHEEHIRVPLVVSNQGPRRPNQ